MAQAVTAQPFADLVNSLERAARNGTRAHLDAHIVRALIGSDAYPIILQHKTKEMTDLWQDRNEPPRRPAEPNLDRSGSGIAPIGMNGASAGMMTAVEQEAVERAESRRALEVVEQTKRRKRRKTR